MQQEPNGVDGEQVPKGNKHLVIIVILLQSFLTLKRANHLISCDFPYLNIGNTQCDQFVVMSVEE